MLNLYCISGAPYFLNPLLDLKDYGKQSNKAHFSSKECKFPGESTGLLVQGLQDLALNLIKCFNLSSCWFSFALHSLLCVSTKEYIFIFTNTHMIDFSLRDRQKKLILLAISLAFCQQAAHISYNQVFHIFDPLQILN